MQTKAQPGVTARLSVVTPRTLRTGSLARTTRPPAASAAARASREARLSGMGVAISAPSRLAAARLEGSPRLDPIVEGVLGETDDLIVLVALARDEDRVPSAGRSNGEIDRDPAVELHDGLATLRTQPRGGSRRDDGRIFGARVVVGQDRDVGTPRHGASHRRSLRC